MCSTTWYNLHSALKRQECFIKGSDHFHFIIYLICYLHKFVSARKRERKKKSYGQNVLTCPANQRAAFSHNCHCFSSFYNDEDQDGHITNGKRKSSEVNGKTSGKLNVLPISRFNPNTCDITICIFLLIHLIYFKEDSCC